MAEKGGEESVVENGNLPSCRGSEQVCGVPGWGLSRLGVLTLCDFYFL